MEAMVACQADAFANPSSLYREGTKASKKLQEARASIARILEAQPDEIIFTSGGTESNNLAIRSAIASADASSKPHVIATAIEHPSVRDLLLRLEQDGICDVTFLPIDESGVLDASEVKKALRPETVLVSVMYANNEIGTIQPVQEAAKAVRQFKKQEGRQPHALPYVHTDACQAAPYCSLRVPALGIDLLTLDGSKIYGPRSSGILYARRGLKLAPQIRGGDQEGGRRAGTENVASSAGFALALQLAARERESESARIGLLRDRLLKEMTDAVPELRINGEMGRRLPNNISVCMPGMDAEFAVLKLDVRGVCASSVTSCRSKKEDSSSYVIAAISGSEECSSSSLRFTLGRFTTKKEIEKASKAIIEVLRSFRSG